MSRATSLPARATLLALLATATAASAQGESPAARAERLFVEGRAALQAGRYSEACPKLAESQSIDPATGTLLALALCHDREGRTATAWREYQDVVIAAEAAGRSDRVLLARERIQALEPHLSRLTVTVDDDAPADLEIVLDGAPLPRDRWNTPFVLDPGPHVLEASASGIAPWKRSIVLRPDGDRITLAIRGLEHEGRLSDGKRRRSRSREIGWTLGAIGVASIGVGAYFGVRALGTHDDAVALCPTSPCPNPRGVSLNETANTEAWVANIAVGAGIVAAGVGAYFILRKEPEGSVVVTASPSRDGAAATIVGAF